MQLRDLVKQQLNLCNIRISKLSDSMKNYPEGTLHSYFCGNGYKRWISTKGNGRKYLPKCDSDLAALFAKKSVTVAELSDCAAELKACECYLESLKCNNTNHLEELLENEDICNLLATETMTSRKNNWMDQEYAKNPFHPEHLTVPTITGEKVRSKTEAMFMQLLISMGIPFRYEARLTVGKQDFYPDFTVMNPFTGEIFLIEIFGMMDDPNYASKAYAKLRAYATFGYIPDKNLLCFFETSVMPLDMMLAKIILEYFLNRK